MKVGKVPYFGMDNTPFLQNCLLWKQVAF